VHLAWVGEADEDLVLADLGALFDDVIVVSMV
jgi:hypothetical protein